MDLSGMARGGQKDTPRQKFLDPSVRMIGNATQYVSQIRLWIKLIQLGRADRTVTRRSAFSAGVGADKQVVLSTECDRTQRRFGTIVCRSREGRHCSSARARASVRVRN